MINKFTICAMLIALFISASFAQSKSGDYQKTEFFGGYSYQRGRQAGHNGFEVSAVRNLSRYIGIKGDFSAAFRDRTTTVTLITSVRTTYPLRQKSQLYNFLGGLQLKDNAEKTRFKPFAHALAGIGYNRFSNQVATCSNPAICGNFVNPNGSLAGFAGALGGGLDIKVSDRIEIRAIQIDYNPIYLGNSFRNQARFGVGVVFH